MPEAAVRFDADSAFELADTATAAAARTKTRKRATRLNTHWLPSEARQQPPEPLLKFDLWFPAKNLLGPGDVGLSCLWIVHGQRLVDDLASRPCYPEHGFRKLENRELVRVSQVHREVLLAHREQVHASDEVVDVAEAARLRAVAEDRERLVLERLADKRGDRSAVVRP